MTRVGAWTTVAVVSSTVCGQQTAEYVESEVSNTSINQGVVAATGQPFNPLQGLHSSRVGEVGAAPLVPAGDDKTLSPQGIGFTNQAYAVALDKKRAVAGEFAIFHQPLIQIRMRIAEVVRQDNFSAKTVLDQVRNQLDPTTITAHRAGVGQGTVASTRFPTPTSLTGDNKTYNGGLFNLTTGQMNLLGQLLATEFNADLLTCPQVVTLNGQRVELLSGVNTPFNLGQSVLQDGTLSVQQTYYKHIGTYLTITPRIINWGPRGEGQGEAPIRWQHVKDWNCLVAMMTLEKLLQDTTRETVKPYVGTTMLMSTTLQTQVLKELNLHSKREILELLASRGDRYRYPAHVLFHPLDCEPVADNGCPCYWNPSDCTLDLTLVLRQSDPGTSRVEDAARTTANTRTSTLEKSEQVGAAVATVVQLKSGHGAVLAGLIGMRDSEVTSKVPVLGDVPLVGALFRSRTNNRQKTEVIIFLEAEVLPADANQALAESSRDFQLTHPYLNRDVLANPLEAGMERIGFGSYLPPRSLDEKVYWERIGRKVRKSCVATGDVLR